MTKIANIGIGGKNPVRIMGILNTSPESFYKKSIDTSKTDIKNAVKQMESDGADFIDIGGNVYCTLSVYYGVRKN